MKRGIDLKSTQILSLDERSFCLGRDFNRGALVPCFIPSSAVVASRTAFLSAYPGIVALHTVATPGRRCTHFGNMTKFFTVQTLRGAELGSKDFGSFYSYCHIMSFATALSACSTF